MNGFVEHLLHPSLNLKSRLRDNQNPKRNFMKIKTFLAAPIYRDDEKTRIAYLTNIISITLLVAASTYLIVALFESPFQMARFIMSFTLLLALLFSYILTRLHKIHAASIVLSLILLLFTTGTVLLTGGIRAPIAGGYIITFLIAGMLLGKHGGLIFTLLCIISWGGIYAIEISGNLPATLVEHNVRRIWVLYNMLFIVAATVRYLASKSISETLAQIRKQRDNLEEMVSIRTQELEEANKDLKLHQKDLIHAEQQRVMMESIGATLHHFSQPLTSMVISIESLMKKERVSEEEKNKLYDTYKKSTGDLNNIIQKFQEMREYRTKPYAVGIEILDIDSKS